MNETLNERQWRERLGGVKSGDRVVYTCPQPDPKRQNEHGTVVEVLEGSWVRVHWDSFAPGESNRCGSIECKLANDLGDPTSFCGFQGCEEDRRASVKQHETADLDCSVPEVPVSWARRYLVWPIKRAVFAVLRPVVVPDWNMNEDYFCVMCREPVLRRFLTCSRRCGELFNALGKDRRP